MAKWPDQHFRQNFPIRYGHSQGEIRQEMIRFILLAFQTWICRLIQQTYVQLLSNIVFTCLNNLFGFDGPGEPRSSLGGIL